MTKSKNSPSIPPSEALRKTANFTPTPSQELLFRLWDNFILDNTTPRQTFVLKGYAGTGKTTVVSLLVKILKDYGYKTVLLAPTGRAAKVISGYSERKAFTIHRIIYRSATTDTGKFVFELTANYAKNTIFIVDEASMIGDESDSYSTGLLTDLIGYVFENETLNNKLLLIGDTAQLPPVGQPLSPALDTSYLRRNFHLQAGEMILTEVMRQEQKSGILENATHIRNLIATENLAIQFMTKGYRDMYRMTGEKLEDGLRYAYKKVGIENTIVVCRSNKTATQYNQYIRKQIHHLESEIESGDYLLIVRNNYTWLPNDSPAVFLANGEFVQIKKVMRFEEMYGFRFAQVVLQLVDYPEHPPFEAKIHLNTLHSYEPNLPTADNKKLYEAVAHDYADMQKPRERAEAIRKDQYLNALQVKFAYAMTCHKAQGGQWEVVFVEQGYLKEDMLNIELLRWIYTALTRAVKELYLVNFHEKFFAVQ